MNKARYFSIGMDDMRQLGLTNISLQYYLRPAPADLGAAARAADAKYDLLPPAPTPSSRTPFRISPAMARLITPTAGRS